MRRSLALLFVLSLAAVPPLASAAVDTAYVDSVEVSPQQPYPGERFTVAAVIGNAESATKPIVVTDVAIRSKNRELDRAEDLGSIPPGSTIRVPLAVTFPTEGTRTLDLQVYGYGDGGNIDIRYPVVVTVRRGGPQLSIDAGDPVVGTEGTVSVTAVNGEDQPVKNVRLELSGESASVRNPTRVIGQLGPNATKTFSFNVSPQSVDADLSSRLTYTTSTGVTRRLTESVPYAPDPLREDVRVDASVPGGARPPVAVDVANFGNAPLDEVTVTATVDGETVARRPGPAIPPGASRTVSLNISAGVSGPVDVAVDYETGTREGRANATVEYTPSPGEIRLTGIDYDREGDRLHLSGSASNVGLSAVDSVVVSVESAESVTPARPNREYFVGTVPPSDFVSFDLYAQVDESAESIPIRVEYLSEGQRRSEVVQVDVGDLGATNPEPTGSSFPMVPLLIGVGLAVVVVLGVAGYFVVRR